MGYNKKFSYLALGENFDKENHVLAEFYLETEEDFQDTAEGIAAESSIGTWEDISTVSEKIHSKLAAKVYSTERIGDNKGIIRIAYPLELFELDNIPQLLSIIVGNSFHLPKVLHLRLKDIELPDVYVKANKGPSFGIQGIRDSLGVYDRPLLSTIIKPKTGLSVHDHAKFAYQAWVGGVDIVKDDENLADQDINPFYERVSLTLEALREAERVTGQKKLYFPNVSSRLSEMYARAKFVQEMGGLSVSLDILSVGMSGVQFMRDQGLDLILDGHRVMQGVSVRDTHNGVSMLVTAKLARLIGIDQLHVPPIIGESEGTRKYSESITNFLKSKWHDTNRVMPISSGGLHPGHIQKLIEASGQDQIINMGAGIFAHPDGVETGARALRLAVEGVMSGSNLREISGKSVELKKALDKWGVFGEEGYEHKNTTTSIHSLVKSDGLELAKIEKKPLNEIGKVEIREEQ